MELSAALVDAGLEQIDRAVRGYLARNTKTISDADEDDVRQHLAVWLIEKGIPGYDGRIDFDKYLATFIRWRMIDAFRSQIWEHRRYGPRPLSLDAPTARIESEPFTLGETLDAGIDIEHAVTLRIRLGDILEGLTPFQQHVVCRTADGELSKTVAADWGLHEASASIHRTNARRTLRDACS